MLNTLKIFKITNEISAYFCVIVRAPYGETAII